MKKIENSLLLVLMLLAFNVSAQQDAQFTQYMDNTLFLNPAYAGSRGMLNMTAIHREQWVGIDGRPRSTTFSIHSPLSYESVGLGFTAVNDIVGPTQSTLFYGDASYTLRFKESNSKLAFGVKGGINMMSNRTDQLQTTQQQDPGFLANIQNQINPNFGVGIYYHTPKFFAGVSVPKILEQSIDGSATNAERRHYFFIAGGVFDIARQWKLRPTTQLKVTNGAPMSIDLSAAAIYNEKLWLGLMHRWGDSFGAFVQYQLTPQFKAGIAYDQTITDLAGYNVGSYEVLLSYDFVFQNKGLRSPRFF